MKIAGFALLIILIYVFVLLKSAGAFRSVEEVKYGTCEKIGPALGPEDIVSLGSTAIVSSDPRDETLENGKLLIYNIETKKLTDGTPRLDFPFHPHGIDLFSKDNKSYLYVVNHLTPEHTRIEVFNFDGELHFLKSIENELFQSANDLIVTDVDQFYVTSDFGTPNRFAQKVQQYTWQKSGYVSFYDGKSARKVRESVFFANGITKSPEGKIFVAGMLDRAIFELNGKAIDVEGAPDNLTYFDGKLYAALHLNLLTLKKVLEDRTKKAPSKIVEIDGNQVSTIYENSGEELSAASVALPVSKSRILIGSVFDDHFLDCTR